MKVAELIAERLKTLGCEDVYMVTGGAAMHLNDAFKKAFDERVHHLHHEQSCAMAAESYARIKGVPAIVNVTAGPGAINAINGVFGAFVDSIPMIVVSGQAKTETLVSTYEDEGLRQLGDQEVDIVNMVKKICKKSILISNAKDIGFQIDECYKEATNGRPGPVWMDVPIDIQGQIIKDEKIINSNSKVIKGCKRNEKIASDEEIDKIAQALTTRNRPVLYIGNGIRISESVEELLEFLEKWQIAVVTGWNANDIIWDDHNCYCGRAGTIGTRAGNFTVQNSECLIILGSRLNLRQVSFNWKSFGKNAWKCQIDIDKHELNKSTLSNDLNVEATLRGLLPRLTTKLEEILKTNQNNKKLKNHWKAWIRNQKILVEEYDVIKEALKQKKNVVNPYRLLREISLLSKEGAVTVCADGTACVVGLQASKIKKGQRIFHNSGCASMGYELPAAIGAYHATNKKIICIAGDGSIMMNLQELAIIGGAKMPILIIILNNKGYHSIRQTQDNYFKGQYVGVGKDSGLAFPDFKKIAMSFDIEYSLLDSEEETREIILEGMKTESPKIIEAIIDLEQQFAPKLASKRLDCGKMITAELEDMTPLLDEHKMKKIKNQAFNITL